MLFSYRYPKSVIGAAKLDRSKCDLTEMEETMSGGEFEVTPSSEIPKSANVQRLCDEVEWLRLGYETIA